MNRQFRIRDNGEPVEGVAVDELVEIGPHVDAAAPCRSRLGARGAFLLEEGNIIVRDA